MLALLVSFLIAVYLLGPDLLSRWASDFVVFRKARIQSRSEEITRAVLIAIIPLILAVLWAKWTGTLARVGRWEDLETVFSALESDAFFQAHHTAFFLSLRAFFWINLCILWRLYTLVALFSATRIMVMLYYKQLRDRMKSKPMRYLLASIVPRISEWDILFSEMLLPEGRFVIAADVLTKSNALYQGTIQDRMLNPDGSLQGVILANPRRFLREEFQREKLDDPGTPSDDFWINIPGNLFIVMASDIANLNLKYIRQKPLSFEPSDEEKVVLTRLLERLKDPK
jgi:hypothetical protein